MSIDPTSLPRDLLDAMQTLAEAHRASRQPDQFIPSAEHPYMLRWHVMRKNKLSHIADHGPIEAVRRAIQCPFTLENAYIHRFKRSEDERALHDHPWPWVSIVMQGEYIEHVPADPRCPFGPTATRIRRTGSVAMRFDAAAPHRVELTDNEPLTMFMTGTKAREWGFYCEAGWRHNDLFMARGCE